MGNYGKNWLTSNKKSEKEREKIEKNLFIEIFGKREKEKKMVRFLEKIGERRKIDFSFSFLFVLFIFGKYQ